jgi:hypothetical protein
LLHAIIAFGCVIETHGVQDALDSATIDELYVVVQISFHCIFISYFATQKSCVVKFQSLGTKTYHVGQVIGQAQQLHPQSTQASS